MWRARMYEHFAFPVSYPEMEFFDTNLTKDSSFLLPAIHKSQSLLLADFKENHNSIPVLKLHTKKQRNKKLFSIHVLHFVEQKTRVENQTKPRA